MNKKLRITEIWAYVATDDGDGSEGVVSMQIGDTHMPMVGADLGRVQQLRPYAEQIARLTGATIQLRRFTNMSVLATIEP